MQGHEEHKLPRAKPRLTGLRTCRVRHPQATAAPLGHSKHQHLFWQVNPILEPSISKRKWREWVTKRMGHEENGSWKEWVKKRMGHNDEVLPCPVCPQSDCSASSSPPKQEPPDPQTPQNTDRNKLNQSNTYGKLLEAKTSIISSSTANSSGLDSEWTKL